jgi:hypothetical protein
MGFGKYEYAAGPHPRILPKTYISGCIIFTLSRA